MTETERALFDAVGPRARRRIQVLTVLSVLLIAGIFALAYLQFYRSGQLAPSRWAPLYDLGNVRFMAEGLGRTAWAALGAGAIALPLGLLLAIGRLSRLWPARWAATAVIEIFRSVPVLLIIYMFTSALPQYGINPDVYWKLVIPVGLCAAAVIAEVIRAGVLSIARGQTDAGVSVGLTDGQTFRLIILPQAVRVIIPSLIAQVVIVVKDTAFGYVVSYQELMQTGRVLVAINGDIVQTYLVITVVYIAVNIAISRGAQRVDRMLAARQTGRRFLPIMPVRRGDALQSPAAAGAGPRRAR